MRYMMHYIWDTKQTGTVNPNERRVSPVGSGGGGGGLGFEGSYKYTQGGRGGKAEMFGTPVSIRERS